MNEEEKMKIALDLAKRGIDLRILDKYDEKKKATEKTLIGKRVTTYDGHSGLVIKHFKPTGRSITIHIKQDDGRIWYCPENDIIDVKE